MILKGAEIARYLARPDPTRPALLIYGQDAMRVALKRAEVQIWISDDIGDCVELALQHLRVLEAAELVTGRRIGRAGR